MHKHRHKKTVSKSDQQHSHTSWESLTAGLPPGTLLEIPGQLPVSIACIKYNASQYQLSTKLPFIVDALVEASPDTPANDFTWWINIENPNPEVLASLTDDFSIHPLVLEEIQNPLTRPKFEDYGKYLYTTIQRAEYVGRQLERNAVHLICGSSYIISFFNTSDPVYANLTNRIINDKGYIRKAHADYLLFTILDECIDLFFPIIEDIELHIEELEATILKTADQEILEAILFLKRSVSDIRHSIWPLTEVIGNMQRSNSVLLGESIKLYLRDIVDHGLHLTDLVNGLRDMASSLLELYHSSITSNLNRVMKVLTVISTIFIPITFLAGFYGMNFQFMPELAQPIAYPIVIGVMIATALGLLFFFKRKRWI